MGGFAFQPFNRIMDGNAKGRGGKKQDALCLSQHPICKTVSSQKKKKSSTSKMQPVIFSNLGCLALSVGLPKHTVVLQHLCACTTPKVLLPPSLPFTHGEPVHWGTAKFTLHVVTAPRVGNRTEGGKEREVTTSVGSSAKKWELCSGEVTLD